MREWIKNGARLIFACVVAGALAFGLFLFNAFPLNELDGAHTYYLYSPSSQAQMQTALCPFDALFLTGESVSFSKPQGKTDEEIIQTLVKQFNAEIVAKEEICGEVSYYAFSPNLQGGAFVQGVRVNLHIALSKEQCAVGTPVVFGGF